MKEADKLILRDLVEEFIAAHEKANSHYLFDTEIIKYFPEYKKKHVKEAIGDLR